MNENFNVSNSQISEGSPYICGSKFIYKFNIFIIFFILGCGEIKYISSNMINLLCSKCSGRIFYKKRTNKPTQYEAR